jgi:hypothetical protein
MNPGGFFICLEEKYSKTMSKCTLVNSGIANPCLSEPEATIQERWMQLCSSESSLRLQDPVKKHAYKKQCGDDGTLDNEMMADDNAPLFF